MGSGRACGGGGLTTGWAEVTSDPSGYLKEWAFQAEEEHICKGPEVGPCFTALRNSEEPSRARREQVREGGREGEKKKEKEEGRRKEGREY